MRYSNYDKMPDFAEPSLVKKNTYNALYPQEKYIFISVKMKKNQDKNRYQSYSNIHTVKKPCPPHIYAYNYDYKWQNACIGPAPWLMLPL